MAGNKAAPQKAAPAKPAPAPAKTTAVAKAPAPGSKRAAAEVREPEPRAAATAAATAAVAAAPAPVAAKTTGTLRIAVSPWGQVEVDGVPAGTTPPLNELTLSEGKHQIIIRNGDFPPFRATVTVNPGQAVSLKHKFGS